MRRFGLVSAIGAWLMSVGLTGAPQTSTAQALLTKARSALGGERAFASFKVTGTIKSRNFGESGRFEISCDLPWRFVQFESRAIINPGSTVDDWSAGGASIDRSTVKLGFDGDDVIYEYNPYGPRFRYEPRPLTLDQRQRILPLAREAFVNLTVGLFASSFPVAPVMFADASGPDASRAVEVNGSGLSRILVFDAQTALPERFGDVRYLDYRDVSGRKVPSRIVVGNDQFIIEDFKILK